MIKNRWIHGDIRTFLKTKERESKIFRSVLKKETVSSSLVAENAVQLSEISLGSIRLIKSVCEESLSCDGIMRLYRLLQNFLVENESVFSLKKLKEMQYFYILFL